MNLWWGSRQDSVDECAPRLMRFLNRLAATDATFSDWRKGGWGGKGIYRPYCVLPLTIEEATRLLDKGREYYDTTPRKLWPEMGFGTGAWNGRDDEYSAGFDVRAGLHGTDNPHCNAVSVNISRRRLHDDAPWSAEAVRALLAFAVDVWKPREASVDCRRYESFTPTALDPNYKPRTAPLPPGAVLLTTSDKLLIPWVGWLTYLPADLAAKVAIPPEIGVERLDDGGIIATLCDEPFTIENPIHMAHARAMEAAIRPVQSI
jgi:hypothetical protein